MLDVVYTLWYVAKFLLIICVVYVCVCRAKVGPPPENTRSAQTM